LPVDSDIFAGFQSVNKRVAVFDGLAKGLSLPLGCWAGFWDGGLLWPRIKWVFEPVTLGVTSGHRGYRTLLFVWIDPSARSTANRSPESANLRALRLAADFLLCVETVL